MVKVLPVNVYCCYVQENISYPRFPLKHRTNHHCGCIYQIVNGSFIVTHLNCHNEYMIQYRIRLAVTTAEANRVQPLSLLFSRYRRGTDMHTDTITSYLNDALTKLVNRLQRCQVQGFDHQLSGVGLGDSEDLLSGLLRPPHVPAGHDHTTPLPQDVRRRGFSNSAVGPGNYYRFTHHFCRFRGRSFTIFLSIPTHFLALLTC